MEKIDKISISSIAPQDLFTILKSLEYSYEHTQQKEFISLRNSIVSELCFLTNTSEDDFINNLKSLCNKL